MERVPRTPTAEPEPEWEEETTPKPNLVQELAVAAGVKQELPPTRYVLWGQHHGDGGGVSPLVANQLPEPIPVIDLSRLPSDAREAAKLQAALQGCGLFFLVINHGIEASLMDVVTSTSNQFFDQTSEEKQKYSNLIDGKHFQVEGYGNDQIKTQDQTLDWSDRLHLIVGPEDDRNLAVWPKRPESFRFALEEYTSKSKRIEHIVVAAMVRLLDLDEGYFLSQFSDRAATTVRINHYVPCPRPDLVLGFKAHSDDGVLATRLVDNHVSALQVLKDGTWLSSRLYSSITMSVHCKFLRMAPGTTFPPILAPY
ncbi:hypothetical protein BS78_05G082400 [Paspalum vaginatum]|nr:hypothetical protein BS78_05G082400 [Paspalum vaginatum]KAJ1274706.1 hypothetical protein BS78_05G082400 [Paspalum vaginatum]KAJ1274707.1 hypothetical protein BS78_05G082400 [Paspalum vaginatum]KAJ1274708.1 hypothetical protein BS78_05G082400 [Paspalum vaginatum]KAJ1274709.1 hypothetical protein BS78_05G082400 [Paspalum vaginatum]